MSNPKYHHGELRQTTLSIAREFVEKDGAAEIKIRSIATQAGVTPMAIYKHFASKDALVNALAVIGFNELAQRVSEARENAKATPLEQLRVMLVAYFEHGNKNPGLYSLMFKPSTLESRDEELVRASKSAFSELYNCFKDSAGYFRFNESQCMEYASLVWAMSHGVTALFSTDHTIAMYFKGNKRSIAEHSAELIVNGLRYYQDTP